MASIEYDLLDELRKIRLLLEHLTEESMEDVSLEDLETSEVLEGSSLDV